MNDPPFKDPWYKTEAHYQELRAGGKENTFMSYKIRPVIVKANDDLR